MADVRAQSGVPVAANFSGFLSPTPSTPIVIDLATGGAYFLGTGDVVTSIGSYISGNSQITGTLNVSGAAAFGGAVVPSQGISVQGAGTVSTNVQFWQIFSGVTAVLRAGSDAAPDFGTTSGHDLYLIRNGTRELQVTTSGVAVAGAFGCNTKTPQTAFASGGALAAYGAGANGFDTEPHASALYAMVVAIRAALVANGIMS